MKMAWNANIRYIIHIWQPIEISTSANLSPKRFLWFCR